MSSSQVVWLAHTEYSCARTRTQMVTTVLVSPRLPLLSHPSPSFLYYSGVYVRGYICLVKPEVNFKDFPLVPSLFFFFFLTF